MTIPATLNIVSATASKKLRATSLFCSGIAASPRLKSSANTTICSTSPSAAACTMLCGTMCVTTSENVCL